MKTVPITPSDRAKIDRPRITLSGEATKKIWKAGITRATRPDAMLNTRAKTITGAASWTPRAKLSAMVRMARVAKSSTISGRAGAISS